jgi:hypothetical protein
MITYLSHGIVILDSLGHSISSTNPAELLDFLLYSCSATHPLSTLRAFWDLDNAVNSIPFPVAVRESFTKTNRAVWGNYRLFSVPSKMFGITKSHDDVTFYDLSQYFPDETCNNIEQVQQKGDELLVMLAGLGVAGPTKLTSPVAIAEGSELIKGYQSTIPTIFTTPEPFWEAFEYALQCTPREWVSNFQVGRWDNLWDIDLTSSYPSHASQLLDLRDCNFVRSDTLIKSAYYGFLYGDLYIDPSHPYAFCSPVVINLDGKLSNPVGHLPTDYYPLDLIRFINCYDMGTFKLKSGWFISPQHAVRPRQPFKELMSTLYTSRSQSPLASYFLKRVMNGVIGRLLETRKKDGALVKYGDLYNPIYHAIITSQTKIKVAEFIIENGITQGELVHVGVDGIKSTKYIDLPPRSSKMGQWVCKGSQPTIILSPGRIYTPIRPKDGATYHLLSAITDAFPNRRSYEFNGTTVDLNILQVDQTRNFRELPHTGGALMSECYKSEPLVL